MERREGWVEGVKVRCQDIEKDRSYGHQVTLSLLVVISGEGEMDSFILEGDAACEG